MVLWSVLRTSGRLCVLFSLLTDDVSNETSGLGMGTDISSYALLAVSMQVAHLAIAFSWLVFLISLLLSATGLWCVYCFCLCAFVVKAFSNVDVLGLDVFLSCLRDVVFVTLWLMVVFIIGSWVAFAALKSVVRDCGLCS